jgi:hypothetical protein
LTLQHLHPLAYVLPKAFWRTQGKAIEIEDVEARVTALEQAAPGSKARS